MRKKFLEPEMDVIKFGKADIITTSPLDGSEQGNNGEGGEDSEDLPLEP